MFRFMLEMRSEGRLRLRIYGKQYLLLLSRVHGDAVVR